MSNLIHVNGSPFKPGDKRDYHRKSTKEFTDLVYTMAKKIFPSVMNQRPDFKEEFSQKCEKFNGIKGSPIEILPGLFETSKENLRFRRIVMAELEKIATHEVVDGVYQGMGIPAKDIPRLTNIVSSDVEATYVLRSNAVALTYSQEYYLSMKIFFKEVIKRAGYQVLMYTHKRRGSSNGCIFKESNYVNYNLIQQELLRNWNDKEYMDYFTKVPKISGILTRRMVKTPKERKVANVKGDAHIHNRELDSSVKRQLEAISEIILFWIACQHRAAFNVTEMERALQPIDQPLVEGIKDLAGPVFKFTEEMLHLILSTGRYHALWSDGTMFDQYCKDECIRLIDELISDELEIFRFDEFRDSKDNVWYDPEEKVHYSLTELAKEYKDAAILDIKQKAVRKEISSEDEQYAISEIERMSKFESLICLDSGTYKVSNYGKLMRVGSEFAMIRKYIDPSVENDVIGFLHNTRVYSREVAEKTLKSQGINIKIKDKSHEDCHIIILDSSDDFAGFYSQKWMVEIIEYLMEMNSNKLIKEFNPVSPDPEYLSFILVRNKEGKIVLAPNVVRRVASMLCPEYSVNNLDGTYKDVNISMAAKYDEIRKHPYGEEVINIIEKASKKVFGCGWLELATKKMAGKKSKTEVTQQQLKVKKVVITEEVIKVLENPDYIYYRDDLIAKIPKELYEMLFSNISPLQSYAFFEKREREDILIKKFQDYADSISTLNSGMEKLAKLMQVNFADLKEAIHLEKLTTKQKIAEGIKDLDTFKQYKNKIQEADSQNEIVLADYFFESKNSSQYLN